MERTCLCFYNVFVFYFDCIGFCRYCVVIFDAHFGGREGHTEVWYLCFCACAHLFDLFFEEFVKLHLGLIWCVEAGVEISDESNLGRVPGVFVPWMFVEVARVISQDLVDFGDLLDAGNRCRCDNAVDNVVSDCAAWAVASGDLLVKFELFLVESWVTGPANGIDFLNLFAFVVPNDDVFA